MDRSMDTGHTDKLKLTMQAEKRKFCVSDFNYNWYCTRTLTGVVPY
jgi:hypothetical protein